tara:strand:- start:11 stop:979 length:969 start_codon:yes stop_codon:yes gene_type:complete
MITIYKKNSEGGYDTIQVSQEDYDKSYKDLGWSDKAPEDFLGTVAEEGKEGQATLSEEDLDALAPIGYTAAVPYQGGFLPVSEYLTKLFPETKDNFYYPGAEDSILDGLKVNQIKTLQDRLVKTPWLDTEDYSVEYGRPGNKTRTALYNALKESNFLGGIGYDAAIDIQLLNPFTPKYEPKIFRPSPKVTRLQKVDAIFNALGLTPSNKERNYYEKILESLEEQEFRVDETVARMAVEGPQVTVTEKRTPSVEEGTEKPMQKVSKEVSVEQIPDTVDAISELQEKIKTDFAGVMSRQQDVGRARLNVGNIGQSIMRLKALGG